MRSEARTQFAPWLLAIYGCVLAAAAVGWHLGIETVQAGQRSGPLLALALDGLLPLVLVYGSYRLAASPTPNEHIWTVFFWSVAGSVAVGTLMGLSILIRTIEGRVIAEPVFVALLAVDTGALAGFVAGTFAVRARQDARRATRTANTLSFVNDLLRHDIANGLVVIDGRATILQRNVESERGQTATEAIREQVTELDNLIDNAGAVAETLGSNPEFEPVDIVPIAETVVERIEQTHNISIDVRRPDTAVVYANDAARSVLWNLVENAVEHGTASAELPAAGMATDGSTLSGETDSGDESSADESHRPSVLIAIRVVDDIVEIHVVDDGAGVPPAERDSIFDPRAGDTHGGGLHLVDTLVDSFGGDVSLATTGIGRTETFPETDLSGAHFVVELPQA